MKGKCNDPRGNREEDGEGRRGGRPRGRHSAVSSSFCGRGSRVKEGKGRGGKQERNVASVSLSAKGSLYRGPLSGRWIAATSYCVSAPI